MLFFSDPVNGAGKTHLFFHLHCFIFSFKAGIIVLILQLRELEFRDVEFKILSAFVIQKMLTSALEIYISGCSVRC